jgi:hypothetical protein
MIMDRETLVSINQSCAAGISTIVSTDKIDLGAAGTTPRGNTPPQDAGRAGMELEVVVTEAFVTADAATLQVKLVESANADLSSPTVINETPVLAAALLVVGYKPRIAVPPGLKQRYLGLNYGIATGTFSAGKVTAGVVLDRQTNPQV